MMIGANNDDTIQESDLTVAVLDGPDVDSGTAAEIGHASSVGKTIVGYRSDSRLCGDNEGSLVNLQVDYYIRKNGGFIVTDRSLPESVQTGPDFTGRAPLPFETSLPGVFAVGDVRQGSLKRVAAAVGEGSSAVRSVHEYLATSA